MKNLTKINTRFGVIEIDERQLLHDTITILRKDNDTIGMIFINK
jgi:hypothetical protein